MENKISQLLDRIEAKLDELLIKLEKPVKKPTLKQLICFMLNLKCNKGE